MLKQTLNLMKKLREVNHYLDGALKIDSWVDTFLDDKKLRGQAVTLLTPWSLSIGLENRHHIQGGKFIPTEKEKKLFYKEIPKIIDIFNDFGFQIEWWIAFSRSCLDERLLSKQMEKEYVEMVSIIVQESKSPVGLINWEDDVIQERHSPSNIILEHFDTMVNKDMFVYEIERWKKWAFEEKIQISETELVQQTKYQVACEAQEGLFLMKNKTNPLCSPGEFLFLILGKAERYNFFSVLDLEFRKRILAVLKPYPWRLN